MTNLSATRSTHRMALSFLLSSSPKNTKILSSRHFGILSSKKGKTLFPIHSSSTFLWNSVSGSNDQTTKTATVAAAATAAQNPNTNEYLVQARIQARMEKNQVRQKSREIDRERNLRIKRLIHTTTTNNAASSGKVGEGGVFTVSNLYAIRVSVDKELRKELKLNGREKRGRMFVEEGTDGCHTIKGLKSEIHAFFRFLKKSTYLLSAGMPKILDDGSVDSPGYDDDDDDVKTKNSEEIYKDFINIENDDDVEKVFLLAQEYFEEHNSNLSEDAKNRLKRPSLLLHIRKNPNAPKPPPTPTYLKNLANPKETETMTMLSFYSFPDGGIHDPEEFGLFLKKVWKPFDALGRVYVAEEGVNAQMSIPTNV